MTELFLDVLNTSFSAIWVVLAVVLARFVLKKAPRWMVCCLWALVAARLLIGGGITAPFSMIPSSEVIPPQSLYEQTPAIHSGVTILDNAINPVYTESLRPEPGTSINPLQVWTSFFANLWVLGLAVMVIWAMVSWMRVRRQVRESICDDGVYLCDRIASPFIFGLFRPKIYLPSDLSADARPHVIAHEKAHLRRRDHWWKPLGFALLAVNWFNPAMWLAYVLLCRDIEMACDEKVIRDLSVHEKKAYSTVLLRCSANPRKIAVCPLAFGEVGVKQRIKSVLNYKKPAFWVVLTAVVLTAVLAVGLLTSPTDESEPPSENMAANLGIVLLAKDVTPQGLKLVYSQQGGDHAWKEITARSGWILERFEHDTWVNIMPENDLWTAFEEHVPVNNTTDWNISFEKIFGSLDEGHYRISKTFRALAKQDDPNSTNQVIEQTCYAEFQIRSFGVILQLEDITPDGATLVCTQDGTLWSEVITGNSWSLEHYENGQWVSLLPESIVWTTEAYPIPVGESRSFDINWSQIIGTLEPGQYKIGKTFSCYEQITLHQSAKEPVTQTWYVLFEINPLGISLHLENITSGGATLVCTQDGTPWEHITTGSDWTLEQQTADGWVSILPEDTAWSDIATMVNQDGTTEWDLNWSLVADDLKPGRYRVGKTFYAQPRPDDIKSTTEGISQTCYAEFVFDHFVLPSQPENSFSPALSYAVQNDWIAYDAMSEFDRLVSSRLPGSCAREFDDWASVEDFIGMEIANPLEGLESLEKGNWAAAPEGFNGGARFRVSWNGTRDGYVQKVQIKSGYLHGDLRVSLSAEICADPAMSTIYAQNGSVLTEADSGEGYEARTETLTRGGIDYTIRVMGDPGTGAELLSLLQELTAHFD